MRGDGDEKHIQPLEPLRRTVHRRRGDSLERATITHDGVRLVPVPLTTAQEVVRNRLGARLTFQSIENGGKDGALAGARAPLNQGPTPRGAVEPAPHGSDGQLAADDFSVTHAFLRKIHQTPAGTVDPFGRRENVE